MLHYYPMNDVVREQSVNHRYPYTIIVNLFTRKVGKEEYIEILGLILTSS